MSELKLLHSKLDERYELLECLGRGSYSEIYEARDAAAVEKSAHAHVVIKALNVNLQGGTDSELERTLLENFRNEAAALDRVRHPNIISRLGHGTALDLSGKAFHYLVLEYLPGGDLSVLCRGHHLPIETVLFYLEQLCAGLAHAHLQQVIHRDIKPQNLLLTGDRNTIKIADFGVAKIKQIAQAEGLITRVGTDVYAPPEHHPLIRAQHIDAQAINSLNAQAQTLTPAADIYSLAKTTYMLLTGESPRRFSMNPITDLPAPVSFEPWASGVLPVLRRATQDAPSSRFQTVPEFFAEFRYAVESKRQAQVSRQDSARDSQQRLAAHAVVQPANVPAITADTFPVTKRREQHVVSNTALPPAEKNRHGRIVVSVDKADPLSNIDQIRPRDERAELSRQPTNNAPRQNQPAAAQSHVAAKRGRAWLVGLILVLSFAAMLFAAHTYVRRRAGANAQPTNNSSQTDQNQIGRELLTTTDVNLRARPNVGSQRIGLAPKGSRVRVLNVQGDWYEVTITERSRPKDNDEQLERGWLNKDFVR